MSDQDKSRYTMQDVTVKKDEVEPVATAITNAVLAYAQQREDAGGEAVTTSALAAALAVTALFAMVPPDDITEEDVKWVVEGISSDIAARIAARFGLPSNDVIH